MNLPFAVCCSCQFAEIKAKELSDMQDTFMTEFEQIGGK